MILIILCTGVTLQTFGPGVGPILLYNLRCTGSESRLVDCPSGSYSYALDHSNDAGVRCQHNPSPGNAMEERRHLHGHMCHHVTKDLAFESCVLIFYLLSETVHTCTYGEVRLVGGSSSSEGRVEMCYRGVWGSICTSGWSNNDAFVVCRQLGFQGESKSKRKTLKL